MTKKEIIKKLAEKYIEIDDKWEHASWEGEEKKYEGQEDLLDDLFDELFGITDLYITDGLLMSHGKKIG